jgi:transposase
MRGKAFGADCGASVWRGWASCPLRQKKPATPSSTARDYFDLWSWDGTLDRIHHALYLESRAQDSREASPTAALIDSQSVKSAAPFDRLRSGTRIGPHGSDAGKKIKGK